MTVVEELSADDAVMYETLISKFFSLDKKEQEVWAKDIFWKQNDVPVAVLDAIARKAFSAPSVTRWAYRNFDAKTLYLLSQVKTLTATLCKDASFNKNFDWRTINHILTINHNMKVEVKNVFLTSLNEELVTPELVLQLAAVYKQSGVDFKIVANMARKAYGYDDALPDSWIEKILE